jgi:CO/xanthine dehydrogenase Mo-binding subunit
MVNVEADVLAGPLLAAEARAAGVVYTMAYGDQPALTCELVEWARACGFDVVAAGKGTKYLPSYHASTPDTVWDHYGLTAAEARADGLGTQPCFAPTTNLDGSPYVSPPHPLLAQDTVRHVGDPVAFVVAETRERAREAADLVDIDYAVLAAATDTAAALSIAQGAGQAPMELAACDPSDQLVTGSFMDYAMPRAADFPAFAVGSNPVPTAVNPLGVKGAGEAGTVGALPAVIGAVADALAPLGIDDVQMPATPERLWRAIRDAAG